MMEDGSLLMRSTGSKKGQHRVVSVPAHHGVG